MAERTEQLGQLHRGQLLIASYMDGFPFVEPPVHVLKLGQRRWNWDNGAESYLS